MIYKDTITLTLYQRRRMKRILNQETNYGILIREFKLARDYKIFILVGGKLDKDSMIKIYNTKTEKEYTQSISKEIIGTWTIECDNDIVELDVR